jgi:hypothetical protein
VPHFGIDFDNPVSVSRRETFTPGAAGPAGRLAHRRRELGLNGTRHSETGDFVFIFLVAA